MNTIFKNVKVFSIVFFIALITDIYVKVNIDIFSVRFISKSLIVLLVLAFYIFNNRERSKLNFRFMIAALSFFLIGDILLILYETTMIYILGIFCFILGKAFYVFRFSNQRDFNIFRLLPFLLLCFLYMSLLLISPMIT